MGEDHGQQESGGALGALIELERRIEAELSKARDEALRVVETARRESLERASQHDGAMAAQHERLRMRIERERDSSLREIVEKGEQTLQLYQRIDEPALRRLAQWVAAQLAEGPSGA